MNPRKSSRIGRYRSDVVRELYLWVADHLLLPVEETSRRSSGMPMMSATTVAGSGPASASRISMRPPPAKRSISEVVISRIVSARCSTALGVNQRLTMLRWRVWSGGSTCWQLVLDVGDVGVQQLEHASGTLGVGGTGSSRDSHSAAGTGPGRCPSGRTQPGSTRSPSGVGRRRRCRRSA